MLPDASDVDMFQVYEYMHLDDLHFIRPPEEVYADEDLTALHKVTEAIKRKFLAAGWEGDGSIGILWLPPFVEVGTEDTWGAHIWHVKQDNNGISFLASPYPIKLPRLTAQNEALNVRARLPSRVVNIVESGVSSLQKEVRSIQVVLSENLRHVRTWRAVPMTARIESDLLSHYQGMMVRMLIEFIDDCYLNLLIEVIQDGNPSRIKIRNSKVSVDPQRYLPDDDSDCPIDVGGAQWLTVRGLIHDLWMSYKFEPIKVKMQKLFGAVEFKLEDPVKSELMKHVVLRNCMQHHEGKLDKDSLGQLGVSGIDMRNSNGTYKIAIWERIVFAEEELLHLGSLMNRLASDFGTCVDRRIPTRHFIFNERMSGESQPRQTPPASESGASGSAQSEQ